MQKFEKYSPVVVTEVTTKHELRQFMQYPNRLYADNPNYIPSFYGDDLSDWTPGKNPAFDYCEARCWLACLCVTTTTGTAKQQLVNLYRHNN